MRIRQSSPGRWFCILLTAAAATQASAQDSTYPGTGAKAATAASGGRSIVETFFLLQQITDDSAGTGGDGAGDDGSGRITQVGGAPVQYDGSGALPGPLPVT